MRHAIMMALVLVPMLAACSEQRAPGPCCPCAPGAQQLDEQLMALLSAARSYHHQADLQLQGGDRAAAIATLNKLLELDLAAKWPEAEEARLDGAARLAKLLVAAGELKQAQELVDKQLGSEPRESFYLGNLHAVRGEILETRVKQLDADGQKDQARVLAKEAISAFEHSISINKRLQARHAADSKGGKAR